jgi:hypothetical protein
MKAVAFQATAIKTGMPEAIFLQLPRRLRGVGQVHLGLRAGVAVRGDEKNL